MAMNRGSMPKQMLPKGPKTTNKPKNMGGKLPAAIGKQKTNHGKLAFNKGGMVRGTKYC